MVQLLTGIHSALVGSSWETRLFLCYLLLLQASVAPQRATVLLVIARLVTAHAGKTVVMEPDDRPGCTLTWIWLLVQVSSEQAGRNCHGRCLKLHCLHSGGSSWGTAIGDRDPGRGQSICYQHCMLARWLQLHFQLTCLGRFRYYATLTARLPLGRIYCSV